MTTSSICLFAASLALAPTSEGEAGVSIGSSGPEASASGDTTNSTARPKKNKRKDQKWIRRWAPERNMWELGIFGGVLFPHPRVELFEDNINLPDRGFRPLAPVAPEAGARLAFFPARFLGLELEGAAVPTTTDNGASALVYAARGQLVAQIPRWSITPFVLAGASGLGISSGADAVGNDIDVAFHFGGGLKFFLSRYVMLRLDARDNLTSRRGVGAGVVHSPEVLLGFGLTLGRKNKEPVKAPIDTDGDGILDPDDQCVNEPGVPEYNGCPIPDTDGDGVLDPDDQCIDEPGVPEYKGCPIPDTDGDGILDPDDKCIDEPGVPEYEGCPIPDTDGDGILDPDDKCVNEPETVNGFEDADGCPDEIPQEVASFTGVIKGIYFDTGKATIRTKSLPILNDALEVLQKHPDLRLEISGHTDDRGDDSYNMQLSQERADSVRDFFVNAGVNASRFETRGAGESEPIESNKKRSGRAKNRRIEFKLLQ